MYCILSQSPHWTRGSWNTRLGSKFVISLVRLSAFHVTFVGAYPYRIQSKRCWASRASPAVRRICWCSKRSMIAEDLRDFLFKPSSWNMGLRPVRAAIRYVSTVSAIALVSAITAFSRKDVASGRTYTSCALSACVQ